MGERCPCGMSGGVCSKKTPKSSLCLMWLCSLLAERTGKVLGEFCRCYKEQYGVALFNSVRYEIEGNGGPQAQLLHRKVRAGGKLHPPARRAQTGVPPKARAHPRSLSHPAGGECPHATGPAHPRGIRHHSWGSLG